MVFRYLNYWRQRARNPALYDYLSEGLGIECRERRVRRFWAPHLRLCREFQKRAVRELYRDAKRFTVLGAGRLLDFDAETAIKPGAEISLVDADPGAVAGWRRFARGAAKVGVPVHSVLCEITGRILGWTEALAAELEQHGARNLVPFLWNLGSLPRTPVVIPECDVLLSLNMLSQIPIHWRERLLKLLRRHAPELISGEDKLPEDVERAVECNMSLLQLEHVELLRKSGTRLTIVISDTEFYYYRRDIAPWQTDNALYDCPLCSLLPGKVILRDTWLWHLAPQGIEDSGYGAIHKVEAFASVLE